MNCRQGDLAVIVRSTAGNEGRIVRCAALNPNARLLYPNGAVYEGAAWRVHPPVKGWNGAVTHYALDSQLRPLRGLDGVDEMVRLAGRPNETVGGD